MSSINMEAILASFVYFHPFSHSNSNINLKLHRCCAWDPYQGPEDGRYTQIHWTMAATVRLSVFLSSHFNALSFAYDICTGQNLMYQIPRYMALYGLDHVCTIQNLMYLILYGLVCSKPCTYWTKPYAPKPIWSV